MGILDRAHEHEDGPDRLSFAALRREAEGDVEDLRELAGCGDAPQLLEVCLAEPGEFASGAGDEKRVELPGPSDPRQAQGGLLQAHVVLEDGEEQADFDVAHPRQGRGGDRLHAVVRGAPASECAGPLVSQMTCSVVRCSPTTSSSSNSSAWMRTFDTPRDRASSNATRTSCREAALSWWTCGLVAMGACRSKLHFRHAGSGLHAVPCRRARCSVLAFFLVCLLLYLVDDL